ncbi:phospholipase D family protein [Arthrobacter sp. Marseille-P9274]|nr:phospholipase D family protein [Arthrobacter sp. Marseille-P9274]
MTGSHNWNFTSLHRNDEAIVETTDAGIYDQYEANFDAMWAAAGQ